MKSFKPLVIAGLLALSGQAKALNLDLTSWGGPGNHFIDTAVWLSDSAMLIGGLETSSGTRDALYVTHGAIELIPDSGIYMTYQLSVPVEATQDNIGESSSLAIDTTGTTEGPNRIKLGIIEDTGTTGVHTCGIGICQATGVGYGDGLAAAGVGGSFAGAGFPGDLTDVGTIIAEGYVRAASPTWNVNVSNDSITTCLDGAENDDFGLPASGNADDCTQKTVIWAGAGTLGIDITEQLDTVVLSDLEGTNGDTTPDLMINDVLSSGHDFESPFATATPSSSVVGETADLNGYADNGNDVMDFECGNSFATDTCDLVAQTSAQAVFNDARIPEPGTIGLAGLGLMLVGAARRRQSAKS